jgi:hypothetical protein
MSEASAEPDALSADRLCVRCGYNLRSLRRTGRCPECNTPIARSLRTRMLAESNPAWLRAMRDGAIIYAVCDLVTVARLLVFVAFDFYYFDVTHRHPSRFFLLPFLLALTNLRITVGLISISFIGLWLMGKPEPRPLNRNWIRPAIRLRQLTVCAFGAVLINRLGLVKYFLADVQRAWSILESVLAMLVMGVLAAYLSKLSERLDEFNLANRFKTLRWLYPAAIAVYPLLQEMLRFFHLRSSSQFPNSFMFLEVVSISITCWGAICILQFAAAIIRALNTQRTANSKP